MLMANAKRRSAALKSSTPINGFQHRLLPLPFSEANASGMVSNQNERLSSFRKPPRMTCD
jgi:hypothetical protein